MIEFFTAWWSYGFMRNAFIAILIITPLFGILGTMIVNNKMAFFSDALGHSALTGIALGVVEYQHGLSKHLPVLFYHHRHYLAGTGKGSGLLQ